MGTIVLKPYVSARMAQQYEMAKAVLDDKAKRDGIAPMDRVVAELLPLYLKKNYARVLLVGGVRRRFELVKAVPEHVLPQHGGKQLEVEVPELRQGESEYLHGTALGLLGAVRHDLTPKAFCTTAPSEGHMAVGGVIYTAAVVSRRLKTPFGQLLFDMAGG